MRRFLILVLVFVAVFAVSCSGKKKEEKENVASEFEEQVSKEISAEEGGTVESSDGKTSIEIPGGALENDTVITMRIYDAEGYKGTDGKDVVSKVVEFEPSGTVFKKPVMISMTTLEDVQGDILRAAKKKVITAAVYREEKGEWSYSKTGAAVKISGHDDSGDPIMTTAAGDPIMLNAAGDPIMNSAAGDPIMLSAAGDPIMVTAAGDPIMNSAAGDPIMMTTGHFTSYAFFFVEVADEEGPVEEPAEEDKDDEITDIDEQIIDDDEISDEPEDTDEPAETDDDEPAETDDDVIPGPEPEPQYSKVVCTNMAICTNDNGKQIVCPAEDAEFYGQDAQYAARKSCVPHHSFERIPKNEFIENDFVEIKDKSSGLTWLFTGEKGPYEYLKTGCDISYGGSEDWRLPTPKELLMLAHNEMIFRNIPAVELFYFWEIFENSESSSYFGPYTWSSAEGYLYSLEKGQFLPLGYYANYPSYFEDGLLVCVSGKEYGKVKAENYVPLAESEGKVIFDAGTNLYWQKDSAQIDSWKEALSYCENLEYAGFDDWRLPNKNELVSLVNYSKAGTEAEVLSSFPGMTPDIFWSSTGADYGAWALYMKDGTLDATGGEGGGGIVSKSIKRDEIETEEEEYEPVPTVRCVRSLLDEKNDIPDCGETGIAPCKDANGTVWSSVIYFDRFAGFDNSEIYEGGEFLDPRKNADRSENTVYVYSLVDMCHNLYESGSHKWRLPTIDEIRSLVTTDKLKTGGSCGVTDEHFESSYFSEEACSGDDPSETVLFDYGFMLSGTLNLEYSNPEEEIYPDLWGVSVYDGSLATVPEEIPLSALAQRCVLDETLNYEETPYLDPETGLLWSDISSDYLDFEEAEDYCSSLMEGTDRYWRLPTVDELLTLVVNCSEDEAPCPMDLNGKYSVFRDNNGLWSLEQTGYDSDYYVLYFEDASVGGYRGSWTLQARCVSDGPNPCRNDPCADVQHSTGCFPYSSEEYDCECEENYFWNGSQCVDPCDADPCAGVLHSTGCSPDGLGDKYHCVCEENYIWNVNNQICKAKTKTENCTAELPENAEWWSESITQTWSGTEWLPATGEEAVYSEEEVENECRFKCRDGYVWESGECVNPCDDGYFWDGEECVTPCEADPCAGVSYATGCVPDSPWKYHCACEENFAWSGGKCLPECGSGSEFPCVDSATSLIWSSRNATGRNWFDAVSYCEELDEGGYTDWGLPTIDELRTIVVNCPGTQAGGACAISDPDHLWESDRVNEDCYCAIGSGNIYSKFGNDTELWSSSDFANGNTYAWRVYFSTANVNSNEKSSNRYPVRCVRKDLQVLPSN